MYTQNGDVFLCRIISFDSEAIFWPNRCTLKPFRILLKSLENIGPYRDNKKWIFLSNLSIYFSRLVKGIRQSNAIIYRKNVSQMEYGKLSLNIDGIWQKMVLVNWENSLLMSLNMLFEPLSGRHLTFSGVFSNCKHLFIPENLALIFTTVEKKIKIISVLAIQNADWHFRLLFQTMKFILYSYAFVFLLISVVKYDEKKIILSVGRLFSPRFANSDCVNYVIFE